MFISLMKQLHIEHGLNVTGTNRQTDKHTNRHADTQT